MRKLNWADYLFDYEVSDDHITLYPDAAGTVALIGEDEFAYRGPHLGCFWNRDGVEVNDDEGFVRYTKAAWKKERVDVLRRNPGLIRIIATDKEVK